MKNEDWLECSTIICYGFNSFDDVGRPTDNKKTYRKTPDGSLYYSPKDHMLIQTKGKRKIMVTSPFMIAYSLEK